MQLLSVQSSQWYQNQGEKVELDLHSVPFRASLEPIRSQFQKIQVPQNAFFSLAIVPSLDQGCVFLSPLTHHLQLVHLQGYLVQPSKSKEHSIDIVSNAGKRVLSILAESTVSGSTLTSCTTAAAATASIPTTQMLLSLLSQCFPTQIAADLVTSIPFATQRMWVKCQPN